MECIFEEGNFRQSEPWVQFQGPTVSSSEKCNSSVTGGESDQRTCESKSPFTLAFVLCDWHRGMCAKMTKESRTNWSDPLADISVHRLSRVYCIRQDDSRNLQNRSSKRALMQRSGNFTSSVAKCRVYSMITWHVHSIASNVVYFWWGKFSSVSTS